MPISLTNGDGEPVNAAHGFGRFIGDLLESESPEHIAVAFDESLTTSFRNQLYPPYKANREPAPVELKRQFAWCRELCRAYGIADFSSSSYEADDLIGTLAWRARERGQRTIVVTRDKDLSQLIRPGDIYWDYIAKLATSTTISRALRCLARTHGGLLALTGDAVDNIRGVPGSARNSLDVAQSL